MGELSAKSLKLLIHVTARASTNFGKAVSDKFKLAAGKVSRDEKIKNPETKPCSYCTQENIYDGKNPYSSRRSVACPAHIVNTAEYIEQNVGRNYQRVTRKTGLSSCIPLQEQEKSILLRRVSKTVEDYREVIAICIILSSTLSYE